MSVTKRKIILFTGSKDSGKTTLIGKIFNIDELSFEEPTYYKDYILNEKTVVREIAGRIEVMNILHLVTRLWNIDRVVIVADASKISTIYESLDMSTIFNAEKRCLALNKIDIADKEALPIARELAKDRNIEVFPVSCKTGQGIRNLALWLQGKEIIPETKSFQETLQRRTSHRKDIIPYPSGKIPLNIHPDMSIDELRKLLPQRELNDIDRQILSLVDGKKTISQISKILKLSKFEIAVRIRKLKNKGYIRELKIVIV